MTGVNWVVVTVVETRVIVDVKVEDVLMMVSWLSVVVVTVLVNVAS